MQIADVQYINDAEGNPIGVFVPIEEYRKVYEPLFTREQIKQDIQEGLRWALDTPDEEKEEITDIDAFINELKTVPRAAVSGGSQEA